MNYKFVVATIIVASYWVVLPVRAVKWNDNSEGFNSDLSVFGANFAITTDNGDKKCRVRNLPLLDRGVWNYWTGFYCYLYTPAYRLNFKYTYKQIPYENIQIPVTMIDNETFFWYDYTNDTSLKYIKRSFKTDTFYNLWTSCCQEAVDCCDNYMDNTNIYPTDEHPCPAIWDAWTCFPPAKSNSVVKMPCTRQAYSTDSEVCELESEKYCFPNGTWNQTSEYGPCAIAPVLRSRHNFHVIFLSIAIAFSTPAFIIFVSIRKFRNITRICLHRNLLFIIIIRNILTIMSKEIILLDALNSDGNDVMKRNGVVCRVLAFFENVAKNGIYACMLVDGFYLHKSIVRVFAKEPNINYLYGVVVVLSFLPSLIWATVRGAKGADSCWMVDDGYDQWIIDGFRFAILGINVVLLCDIIRVMVMKLKHGSTSQQAKTTFRATLFLLPLFGIHIIVTANRNIVSSNTCKAETIFYQVSYSLEALQGIIVAILFCYISPEVHNEFKQMYRKFAIYVQERYGVDIRRETLFRRTTAATYVDQSALNNYEKAANDEKNEDNFNVHLKNEALQINANHQLPTQNTESEL